MAFLRTVFAKPKAINRSVELLVAKGAFMPVHFELGFLLSCHLQLDTDAEEIGSLFISLHGE